MAGADEVHLEQGIEGVHAHPRFESTPIIFVTGVHVSELDRLKGYELGAVDYVYVPVVPEILRSKVAVLVELHCQRLELKRLNDSLTEANSVPTPVVPDASACPLCGPRSRGALSMRPRLPETSQAETRPSLPGAQATSRDGPASRTAMT